MVLYEFFLKIMFSSLAANNYHRYLSSPQIRSMYNYSIWLENLDLFQVLRDSCDTTKLYKKSKHPD